MMSYYEFIDLLHNDFSTAMDLCENPEYDVMLQHYFEEQERYYSEWTDGDELQMQLNPPKLTNDEELPW